MHQCVKLLHSLLFSLAMLLLLLLNTSYCYLCCYTSCFSTRVSLSYTVCRFLLPPILKKLCVTYWLVGTVTAGICLLLQLCVTHCYSGCLLYHGADIVRRGKCSVERKFLFHVPSDQLSFSCSIIFKILFR